MTFTYRMKHWQKLGIVHMTNIFRIFFLGKRKEVYFLELMPKGKTCGFESIYILTREMTPSCCMVIFSPVECLLGLLVWFVFFIAIFFFGTLCAIWDFPFAVISGFLSILCCRNVRFDIAPVKGENMVLTCFTIPCDWFIHLFCPTSMDTIFCDVGELLVFLVKKIVNIFSCGCCCKHKDNSVFRGHKADIPFAPQVEQFYEDYWVYCHALGYYKTTRDATIGLGYISVCEAGYVKEQSLNYAAGAC